MPSMEDPKNTTPLSSRVTPKAETPPTRPPRPPIGLAITPDGRYALPDGNPCAGCDHCCRYVAIGIPTPRSKRDFDNIRWYILHQNVSVMADWEGQWMVQFDTPCEWLVEGRCTHYEFRPDVCRDYDPAECERYCIKPAEKFLIRTERDLERFLAEREKRVAARARRRRRVPGPA
jgi:Fe-S-cluster containining protein